VLKKIVRDLLVSGEPPPPASNSIALVWAEGIRLIDGQLAAADALDRKITPLIALVSAAFVLAVGQRDRLADFTGLLLLELTVLLIFLLLAFRLRSFATAPALPAFMRWANSPPDEVMSQFMGNLLQAYDENQTSLASKELFLGAAIYAMLFVIVSSLAVVIGGVGGVQIGGAQGTGIAP